MIRPQQLQGNISTLVAPSLSTPVVEIQSRDRTVSADERFDDTKDCEREVLNPLKVLPRCKVDACLPSNPIPIPEPPEPPDPRHPSLSISPGSRRRSRDDSSCHKTDN